MDELEIRAAERKRIAKCIRETAREVLVDPASDAIDGYCAAVMYDLADRVEKA